MSRAINKLSAKRVQSVIAPGWYGDGGGLWLRIFNDGSKRWIYAWERNKRRREMGLGSLGTISLAKARERAEAARDLLADGRDPLDVRREEEEAAAAKSTEEAQAQIVTPTFGAFADKYIDSHEEGWKNAKHRQQWRNSIKSHAAGLLNLPVDAITSDDVLAILEPIWMTIPETSGRLRGRIEIVLDAAKASRHISSPWENPARWRGNLMHMLPQQRRKKKVKHHPAMPYEEIPLFYCSLMKRVAPAARALEFTILHATRTNETLCAKWGEFDIDGRVWTIPGERMKMGIEHRVPLTERGLEILQIQSRQSNCGPDRYVFAGQKRGRPLSGMSMTMVLRRMKLGHYTVHGMRSTFRDYFGDMTDHAETIIEMALAHQVGDETHRAYRRADAFLKRRLLMTDWQNYLVSPPPVVTRMSQSSISRSLQRTAAGVIL